MSDSHPPGRPPWGPDFAALHAWRTARDPARPFLTYYDDTTGERTELSWATSANWVAKTANLLTDGLGVAPGDVVATVLHPHWQAVVVALAAWCAGAAVAPLDPGAPAEALAARLDATGAAAVFAREAALPAVRRSGAEVVGMSLRPLAARLEAVPPGVVDYAEEVPAYGDRFVPAGPGDPALLTPDGGRIPVARLLEAAGAAATAYGVAGGARVYSSLPAAGADAVAFWVLGPLLGYATGAGLVLDRRTDVAAWARRVASERVTHAVLPSATAAALGPPHEGPQVLTPALAAPLLPGSGGAR